MNIKSILLVNLATIVVVCALAYGLAIGLACALVIFVAVGIWYYFEYHRTLYLRRITGIVRKIRGHAS